MPAFASQGGGHLNQPLRITPSPTQEGIRLVGKCPASRGIEESSSPQRLPGAPTLLSSGDLPGSRSFARLLTSELLMAEWGG